MTPFRLTFKGEPAQSFDELLANVQANAGYPVVSLCMPHGKRLAIVGGGPSVVASEDVLRRWDGDIWAINATSKWLKDRGIPCVHVSVDAEPLTGMSGDALMASWCDPEMLGRFSSVRVFHLKPVVAEGVECASATASTMPSIAMTLGYRDVTFFGCEGSFNDVDHVYTHENRPHQLIIRAGRDYRTIPPLMIQCEELSWFLREFPCFFKEESGGLLRAMVANPDWSVVAVSGPLKDHLESVNGKSGLYESEYQWLST